MLYAIPLILAALLVYLFFVFKTGFSREKYGVPAPKTTGNEVWERIYRVQVNTMEQLVIFVPAVLIFSHYVSEVWVLVPGCIFIVGRVVYYHLYVKDPAKRGPGSVMSILSNIAMVLGGIVGYVMSLM